MPRAGLSGAASSSKGGLTVGEEETQEERADRNARRLILAHQWPRTAAEDKELFALQDWARAEREAGRELLLPEVAKKAR